MSIFHPVGLYRAAQPLHPRGGMDKSRRCGSDYQAHAPHTGLLRLLHFLVCSGEEFRLLTVRHLYGQDDCAALCRIYRKRPHGEYTPVLRPQSEAELYVRAARPHQIPAEYGRAEHLQ